MRVLLLGSTGNLGSHLIPSLLIHQHSVIAYVRSPPKLHSLLSPTLISNITVHEGDATSAAEILYVLRKYDCQAIINTAGSVDLKAGTSNHGEIAKAVLTAASAIKRDRNSPQGLRVWLIGGLGSLEYPGTSGYRIEEYMPKSLTFHHRNTASIVKDVDVCDVRWSLLCVAMMRPEDPKRHGLLDTLDRPHGNKLVFEIGKPPLWRDWWVRYIPFAGIYANLWLVVLGQYQTKLEQVADFIADDLHKEDERYVGALVGMKDVK